MNKIIYYLGIIILSSTYHINHAVPMNFKRLVLLDDQNNLIKTVDLIGDMHYPLHDIVNRPSHTRKHLLLHDDEKEAFTTAERTLLNTLRDFAYDTKREPILLLWELSKNRAYKTEITYGRKFSPHIFHHPFMIVAGYMLEKEFTSNPASNIHFLDTDTLRDNLFIETFTEDFTTNTILGNYSIKNITQSLYNLVNKTNPEINIKLSAVLKTHGTHIHKKMHDFWQQYLTTQLKPFLDQWIKPYLNNTVENFIHQLKTQNQLNTIANLFYIIDALIMDFEVLTNLFRFSQMHSIVYAGADHIDSLQRILTNTFGLITIVDIGNDNKLVEGRNVLPQLAPSAWDIFKIVPSVEVAAYHKKGPLIKKVGGFYWDEIKEIIEQPVTDIKRLEEWIKAGFSNHLSAANTRLGKGVPLLMIAIEKNNISMAQILLKYGAKPNAYWFDADNNDFLNMTDIARINNNKRMIQLLERYGGR